MQLWTFFCLKTFSAFDHFTVLGKSVLIVSFFFTQASGNILQGKIRVCRLLGKGFS